MTFTIKEIEKIFAPRGSGRHQNPFKEIIHAIKSMALILVHIHNTQQLRILGVVKNRTKMSN